MLVFQFSKGWLNADATKNSIHGLYIAGIPTRDVIVECCFEMEQITHISNVQCAPFTNRISIHFTNGA